MKSQTLTRHININGFAELWRTKPNFHQTSLISPEPLKNLREQQTPLPVVLTGPPLFSTFRTSQFSKGTSSHSLPSKVRYSMSSTPYIIFTKTLHFSAQRGNLCWVSLWTALIKSLCVVNLLCEPSCPFLIKDPEKDFQLSISYYSTPQFSLWRCNFHLWFAFSILISKFSF